MFESKWFLQGADNYHTCEPNRAKVTANLLIHKMKNMMRSNPAQSCGEVVRTIRVQAASEYGEDDDFYKHLVAELGTDSALERQMLRVKHEIIGPTPKSRNEFDPINFIERIFENDDDDIIVLDSNLLEDNWKLEIENQNDVSRFEWSKMTENLRNIEQEFHQEEINSEEQDEENIAIDVTEKDLPKRVLVYTSRKLLKMLSQNKKSSVDGTFKSSCKLWKQQFIWMVKSNGYWIPCAFGWLPDKSEKSYKIFFLLIKKKMLELELSLKVSSVLSDFELNILKAIDDLVGADIFGCFFHHKDCFRRRVDKKGFKTRYENDEYFHEFINQASGLAHLPIADIEEGLEAVNNKFEFEDEEGAKFKIDFIKYIKEFWIEGCIPPAVWNVFGRNEDLTNNNQEGYNAKMNRELKETHPSPGILLSHIRSQIKLSEEKIIRQKAGIKKPAQRKNYKKLAQNRYNLKKNYIEARNNGEDDAITNFLSAMGHNLASCKMQGRLDEYSETRRNSYVKNGEILDKSNWADISRDDSTLEAFENPDTYENRKIGSKPPKPWIKKKCPSCKGGFNSRSDPIKCDGCDSFTHKRKDCLKESKHKKQFYCKVCVPVTEKTKKNEESPSETCFSKVDDVFKCGKCGISSKSKFNMTRHIERKHKESNGNVGGSDPTEDVPTPTITTRLEQQQASLQDILKDIKLENLLENFNSNGIDLNFILSLNKSDLKDCLMEIGISRFADRHKITEKVLQERKLQQQNSFSQIEHSESVGNCEEPDLYDIVVDVPEAVESNSEENLQERQLVQEKDISQMEHSESVENGEESDLCSIVDDVPETVERNSPENNTENDCDMCNIGTQHKCRKCGKIVCIIKCSIQDPNSENENHRVHREGDSRCVTDENFPCSICRKFFKRREEIEEHMETTHDSYEYSGNFECPSCGKKFTSPSDLQEHIESLHDQTWSSFTLLSNASSTWKYVPCNVCDMHFDNEADVSFHMIRVHEYGEECALYPCEECGYRGQDRISLNNHIQEEHSEVTVESVRDSLMNTLEEYGIRRLPEISKRIKQNFDGLVIDDDGNIELEDSEEEYVDEEERANKVEDNVTKVNTRKRKLINDNSKPTKKQKTVQREEGQSLVCDICKVSFTRKDNLARHKRNKHN